MGWALRRPDGTYRCWNANAQDDMPQPGEVWVSLNTPPLISTPPPTPNPLKAQIDAVIASTDIPAVLKALLTAWKAQL